MKKIVLIFLCFSGCVYYNTFYNTRKYYDEAVRENNNRKFQKSLEKSKKILERYPGSKYIDDAMFIMGASLYYLKEIDESKISFKKLIEVFPNTPFVYESYFFLGRIALERGDLTEANLLLEKASESNDSKLRIEIFKTKLELELETDNPQRTIEEGENFIKKYGTHSGEVYYILGNANRTLEDKEKALEMYKQALKESKDAPTVRLLYNFAELYWEMDSIPQALSVIEKGKSNDSLSLLKGRILMDEGNFEEALTALKTLELKKDSLATIGKYYIGMIKEYQGDSTSALFFYEKALEGKDYGEITLKAQAKKAIFENYSLLKTLADDKKKEKKDENLFKSNFERKDSSYIFFRIGELYYWELEEAPEGIKWYEKVYSDFPKSPYAPKALYTLLNISINEDSNYSLKKTELFSILNEKYPKSEFAKKAKKNYDSYLQDTIGTR